MGNVNEGLNDIKTTLIQTGFNIERMKESKAVKNDAYRVLKRRNEIALEQLEKAIENKSESTINWMSIENKLPELDMNDRVNKIAITTPYSMNEIYNFMILTGLGIDDTEKIMKSFRNSGISNITDVNTLVKLGLFNYR